MGSDFQSVEGLHILHRSEQGLHLTQ